MGKKAIYALFCLGLLQWNVYAEVFTGKIDTGKLRATDSADRLKDDFIVVLNYNHHNHHEKIPQFVEHMKAAHPQSRLLDTYVIRDFIALRVSLPEAEAAEVSQLPDVKFMQSNLEVRASQFDISCKFEQTREELWGLSRVSDRVMPDYSKAKYVYLSTDGEDVDAYVIDTGVLVTHVEFEGRARHGFTATSIKESGEGDSDENGHGTHVSGTVAGANYGIAKKANIVAVKVLNKAGRGTTADVVEGVEFVHNDFLEKEKQQGKKPKVVVNMSLGGGPFAVGGADEAAITMAIASGIPFVVAAGNDAFDACFVSPSRLSSAVTVGATNIDDGITYFSNHGPCVDILAPGQNILSSYIGSNTASALASGTSMASPHVAGIAARFLSQQDEMQTPATVKAWLQNIATDDAVNLDGYISTPNSLLYMACMADALEEQASLMNDNMGVFDLDDDDAWMYIAVSLAVLLLLCFISLVVVCCAFCQTKRILNNIHILQRMHSNDFLTAPPISGRGPNVHVYPYSSPQPTAPSEATKLLA